MVWSIDWLIGHVTYLKNNWGGRSNRHVCGQFRPLQGSGILVLLEICLETRNVHTGEGQGHDRVRKMGLRSHSVLRERLGQAGFFGEALRENLLQDGQTTRIVHILHAVLHQYRGHHGANAAGNRSIQGSSNFVRCYHHFSSFQRTATVKTVTNCENLILFTQFINRWLNKQEKHTRINVLTVMYTESSVRR